MRSSSRRRVGAPAGLRSTTRPSPTACTPRASKSASHCPTAASQPAGSCARTAPPSRSHSSAYSAASSTSRCTTQPSRPDASSQAPTRSVQASAAAVLPVAEQLGHAAGGQHPAEPADQTRDQRIADQPPVAVGVDGQVGAGGAGRDDERRVRHHQVEDLATYRLEQRPGPQVDVDSRERRVEPCEGERALATRPWPPRGRCAASPAGPGSRSRCPGRACVHGGRAP